MRAAIRKALLFVTSFRNLAGRNDADVQFRLHFAVFFRMHLLTLVQIFFLASISIDLFLGGVSRNDCLASSF